MRNGQVIIKVFFLLIHAPLLIWNFLLKSSTFSHLHELASACSAVFIFIVGGLIFFFFFILVDLDID